MTKSNYLIIILLIFNFCSLFFSAKSQPTLNFIPIFNKKPIRLNTATPKLQNGEQLIITKLKFYVGKFSMYNQHGELTEIDSLYTLVDFSKSDTIKLQLNYPKNEPFNDISFNLGVDSLTSVSGVFGGGLDPTLGMYWTWQSGYINFKLEGYYLNSNNKTSFEYHLGGYLPPFETAQIITLKTKEAKNYIVYVDLELFLDNIPSCTPSKVLSSGKNAKLLSDLLAPIFKLSND